MRNRELFRKLALACASSTLLLAAGAPGTQAAGTAASRSVVTAASPAPSPSPSPTPTPKHKNHTVTNPAPPGPGSPQPGLRPLAPQSRLSSALAAAGLAAPASSLAPAPCTVSGKTTTCDLWATTGALNFPGSLPLPVWGFSSVSTPGSAQVPGPVLVADAGQNITIRLHNELPGGPNGNNNQLSIEVPASGLRTDLNGIDTGEQQPYSFGPLRPGTYLYEAGPTANGARQVRMGLAGILVVRPSNFAACNCAYGNGVTDSFVDESTLLLNEFDPAFNKDPFLFDPVEFSPSLFAINGHAFDNSGASVLNKINVVSGDVILFHYANLSEHERGITISNERQTILADDSYILTNPLNVATEWLNPGQVSDSFVTIDPSFAPHTQIPVYDAGLHLSNNGDLGLGGMFTYLDVVQGLAGSPAGPVTAAALGAPTNSGIEDLNLSGTVTASAGATLTDAEWFLDSPGAPGSGPTCPTGGLTLSSGGSAYTSPVVTFSGTGTGAAATVAGSMDAITLSSGGAGYTNPTVSIPGGAATASGSVDAVKLGTPGSHYKTPAVGFTGGGGNGAAATATGPVDGVTLGTSGAGYTSPSVVFTGGGGTAATATASGSIDKVTLTNGLGYTAPVVTLSGGGAGTGATVSVSGGVDGFKNLVGGTGYAAPVVSFSGGGGSGASATAQVTAGVISGITINTAGSGYTSAPTVSIADATPGATGASVNATINVSAVAFTGGSGYTSAPAIGIADSGLGTGSGASATATISVTTIALGAGGSGYTSAPTVAINDTGAPTTTATATSTIGVTGFTLGSGGAAYTSAPLVTITDSGGSGAGATATATLKITTIAITNIGTGYTTAPAVTITDTGGTGTGAAAKSTLTLNAITLTNGGSGYRNPPTVSIGDSGSTGTGAAATASLPATMCIYQHLTIASDGTFKFTILSADLNYLLLTDLNRDGDHIIWVHAKDSNGTWGVVAGDVFTYNATGPVVGALSLHSSPTNGFRPTDVANGGAPAIIVNGAPVTQNAPSNDLVVLGMAASSLSNFVVTGSEYCIDTIPCPAAANLANNPSGPTGIVVTPNGSNGTAQVDAYGNTQVTPTACAPTATAPGVTPPALSPTAPGGGSVVSLCGTVPQAMLMSLSEGKHTLFIHACEQLSSSTGACAVGTPRWGAFSTEAAIEFVIDRHGPTPSALSIDPNPNNGHIGNMGNLNFLDSLQLSATLSDFATNNSNIAYGEVFVTCSPDPILRPSCKTTDATPIDPVTKVAPVDGTGAEMVPSGAAWDSPVKLAFAYIPLAVLTEYHEGLVRLWVHAQDQAGNFGPWAFMDLTYDTTSPVFDTPAIPAPPAAPTSIACTAGCTINFTAHDPLSGGVRSHIVQAEWFIDQGAHVICEAAVTGCTPEVAVMSDPGFGNATPIAIPTPLTETVTGQLTLPAQPAGTKIVFRVKDQAGNWSLDNLVVTT